MTCKYCGAETKWPEPYVKGALMINPDGSEHRCKGKQTELIHTDKVIQVEKPQIPRPETPQPREDASLDNVILRENLLLDQIEDSVKNHLEKKYPLQKISGERIGMRVKEIYRQING